MLEYRCSRCGETFIADATDTVHAIRLDGTPCYGKGELVAEYFFGGKS